jgi:hypothetical protein
LTKFSTPFPIFISTSFEALRPPMVRTYVKMQVRSA